MRRLLSTLLFATGTLGSPALAQGNLDARCMSAAQRLVPSAFSGAMPDVATMSDADFLVRSTEMATTVGEAAERNAGAWVESNRIALQSGDAKARYDIQLTDVQGGVAIQVEGIQIRCQVTFGTSLTYTFSRPVWSTTFTERDIDLAAQAVDQPTSQFGQILRRVSTVPYGDKIRAAQSTLGKEAVDRLGSMRGVSETARPPIRFEFTTAGGRGNETILGSNMHSTYLTAAMQTARASAVDQKPLNDGIDSWLAALYQRVSARSPQERAASAQRKSDADRAAAARDQEARRLAVETLGSQISRCLDSMPTPSGRSASGTVVVVIQLASDGSLTAAPEIISGQDHPHSRSYLTAVRRCSPFRIPSSMASSYAAWKTVHMRFQ